MNRHHGQAVDGPAHAQIDPHPLRMVLIAQVLAAESVARRHRGRLQSRQPAQFLCQLPESGVDPPQLRTEDPREPLADVERLPAVRKRARHKQKSCLGHRARREHPPQDGRWEPPCQARILGHTIVRLYGIRANRQDQRGAGMREEIRPTAFRPPAQCHSQKSIDQTDENKPKILDRIYRSRARCNGVSRQCRRHQFVRLQPGSGWHQPCCKPSYKCRQRPSNRSNACGDLFCVHLLFRDWFNSTHTCSIRWHRDRGAPPGCRGPRFRAGSDYWHKPATKR